jgi:hypothetical protein
MSRYDRERTDGLGADPDTAIYLEPLGGHSAALFLLHRFHSFRLLSLRGLRLQPVADADMSRGESVSRQGKEHGPAFGRGLGGWTVRLSRTSAVPRLCNTGGKARRIRDHTKADRHGFVPHPLIICFGQPSLATSIGSRGPLRRLWLAGGRMVPLNHQTRGRLGVPVGNAYRCCSKDRKCLSSRS